MSDPGLTLARTVELQLALPVAQRQWRLPRFRQRRQQHDEKPTIPIILDKADSFKAKVKPKGKAIYPFLRVGSINLGVTSVVGIMIVASFYLLLLFSGRWRDGSAELVLVRSEQTRLSMPSNLIWEGNEGVAGSRSLDSDLEVGFENDLTGWCFFITSAASPLLGPRWRRREEGESIAHEILTNSRPKLTNIKQLSNLHLRRTNL